MRDLPPWDSSDRFTGDRVTDQTGEVWLKLFRRSVALPEIGFKAAFLLSNSVDFSTKSLCPFCKETLPFPLPCMHLKTKPDDSEDHE